MLVRTNRCAKETLLDALGHSLRGPGTLSIEFFCINVHESFIYVFERETRPERERKVVRSKISVAKRVSCNESTR